MTRFLTFALTGLLVACGTTVVDFPGEGGGTGTGTGTGAGAGSGGGDPCDCRAGGYAPVCGEDGITYDAICGRDCVPVAIACEGECPCPPPTCGELEAAYQEALARAKSCAPQLPVEQCNVEVDDALACPCPTFAESGNTEALAKLDELKKEWDAAQCGAVIDCPAIACVEPKGASCDPGTNPQDGGHCSDLE